MTEESWKCEEDGCEFEKQGEYDPDTGSYPWLECSHCGKQKAWTAEDEDDLDDDTGYYEPNWNE